MSGDGATWASATQYLQDALTLAQSGDEIRVAEGTYKPDQGVGKTAGDRTATFNLVSGVNLLGGFKGHEVNGQPLGDSNDTILSGEIDQNSTFWSLHILTGKNLQYDTTVSGFRITKGHANGAENSSGAGMKLLNSTPLIMNCSFSNCHSLNSGGAIYCYGQSQGRIKLYNCLFSNNSANNGAGIFGSCEIRNSIFEKNSAYAGSGVYGKQFDAQNTVFYSNKTDFSSSEGISSAVHIIDIEKKSNSKFSNCLFYNNKNAFFLDGRAYLRNCTFYNDLGDKGYDVKVQPYNHIILPNNQMTVVHSIFWRGNSKVNEYIFPPNGSATNPLNNLSENTSFPNNSSESAGMPNLIFNSDGNLKNTLAIDPLFLDVSNPIGDDNKWFTKDDGFNLRHNSPLVDSGYKSTDAAGAFSSYIQYLPGFDIAGFKRIQGLAVDIGAYEYGNEIIPTYYLTDLSKPNEGGDTKIIIEAENVFSSDKIIKVLASPNIGYLFSGWSNEANGSINPLNITLDANKTVTANFIKDTSDNDGDGLTNFEELVTYKTNPNSIDSDNDNIPDSDEITIGSPPNSSDSKIVNYMLSKNNIQMVLDSPESYGLISKDKFDKAMRTYPSLETNSTPYTSGWFFQPNRGWIYTNETSFPYMYDGNTSDWLYFESGHKKPRFYEYKQKKWFDMVDDN